MNTVIRTPLSAPAALSSIHQPETNVVSLPRPLLPELQSALEELAARDVFRRGARLDAHAPDVSSLLQDVPEGLARRFLQADIRYLVRTFGALLQRRHVHAQLSVSRSDGCRKIHVDYVTIRLLCTYAGPGTEWLSNDDVIREHLRPSQLDADLANPKVIRAGAALRRSDVGEVLLLKGAAYPGNADRGAAHRSPPLGTHGTSRLVLRIDASRCGC